MSDPPPGSSDDGAPGASSDEVGVDEDDDPTVRDDSNRSRIVRTAVGALRAYLGGASADGEDEDDD